MRAAIIVSLCTALGLVAGCANSEHYYDNVYEGLKTREAMVHPSVEPISAEKPLSYHEYKAERNKLLESNEPK
jgi:outer membrane lipoprotein SlyB